MFDIENNLGPIDILVGADVTGRLFTGKIRVLSSGLVAMETYLGWTLMGKTNLLSEKEDAAMMLMMMCSRNGNYIGIIENDPVNSSSHLHGHYLPHRPVVKQHGTTKIHPVFDASARQVGFPSLNQCLESGPNLLELIPNLLRFREHKYGIVANIEKAFLQISVQPEDRNSQIFLVEWKRKYDLNTSLDNEAEILPFIEKSHHILAEAKFNLRGWKYTGDDDPEQVTSVLGLIRNHKEDELKINLDWIETYKLEIVSKRVILCYT
ncbi:integrase catalytic domain-containing protein [Trichonephila clavipes]|nr:integrase catalytic domain-containing protein [Trichonephila clavipes]